MASTSLDHLGNGTQRSMQSKEKFDETPMAHGGDDDVSGTYSLGEAGSLKPLNDKTHRKLKPRHIQLIGIGGYVEH